MKTKMAAGVLLLAGALALGAYGGRRWVSIHREHGEADAVELASDWLPAAKLKAAVLISRYGPPQEMTDFRLQWDGVGPWKNISIQNLKQATLQQTVTYHVPADKLDALRHFVHGPLVYPEEDELSARSDSEELNRLSLNLASDIAAGRRSPQEADRFFLRTVALRAAGKSSPYMERLLFAAPVAPVDIHPFPW